MIPRKRFKVRRVRARCSVRRCKRPPKAAGLCLSHAKREADRRWAAPARHVDECELAGVDGVSCGGPIQAAHGFPRRYLGTRWLPLNRWLICAGHHRYYTDRWPEWVARLRHGWGVEVYAELDRLRQNFVGPVDYAALLAGEP